MTSLGRYEIVEPIASGGMGTVFRGILRGAGGLERPVAIKRLHPRALGDDDAVKRFLREARLGAAVRHPNVAAILDADVDGEPFLVMELVEGRTLAAILRACSIEGRSIPLPVAGAILGDLLAGLEAVHVARDERGRPLGIVHRDVSPQNVLVGDDGIARLIDFGIARAVERTRETVTNAKGKLGYVAPEQLSGDVQRTTDLYAAAVVAWEILTGQNYAQRSDLLAGRFPFDAPARPPGTIRAELPGAVDAIVLRGLARTPEERWPDAAAMASALAPVLPRATAAEVRSWLDGRDLATTPGAVFGDDTPDAPTVLATPPRRRRRAVIVGVAVAVAVATLAVALALAAWRAPMTPAVATTSEPVAPPPPTLSDSPPPVPTVPTAIVSATLDEPAAPARRPTPTDHRARPRVDCSVPYVVLADGRKHYRAECLRR